MKKRLVSFLTVVLILGLSALLPAADTPPADTPPAEKVAPAEKAPAEKVAPAKPAAAKPAAAAPAADPTKTLVAKVNGIGISQAEFERNLEPYMQRKGLPKDHADKSGKMNQVKKELLDNLISYELLFQDARAKKFEATTAEVDQEFKKFRDRFPTQEEYAASLKEQGMTEDLLRNIIMRGMSVQKLVEKELSKTVSVSDAEIHDFYVKNPNNFKAPEQVRARHILVQVDPKADQATKDAAKKKAEGFLEQVKGGADFAEVAKQNSDCPSKTNGGDLGFFSREQMVKPFSDTAFSLKPGEISGVVETQFGYHIIKVEEHKDAGMTPEKDASAKIKDYLNSTKLNKALLDRVAELRKSAKIDLLAKFE